MEVPLQNDNNTQPIQNQNSTPAPDNGGVAPDASDRTKEQFTKLTESNSTLSEENKRLQQQIENLQRTSQPAPVAPQPVAPAQTAAQAAKEANLDLNSFVEIDPKTGERYVNETKLTQTINDLQSKTQKAESTIQSFIKTSEDQRIQQQKDEAFRAHPELSPDSEQFDKKFYKAVRSVLYDSMVNADEYGKTLSLKEAADYVRTELITSPQPIKGGEEKEETQDKSDAKAQAGSMVPSQPQNAPQPTVSDDLRRLRLATRQGSTDALARRILATNHVIDRT